MKLQFTLPFLFMMAAALPLHAQPFSFADTYPVNNLDSLENWLKTHPKHTEERLKNLIRLEKTYFWGYTDLIGTKLSEISRLNTKLKMPIGTASESYIRAVSLDRANDPTFVQFAMQALRTFTALKDTAGMIHTYCILVKNGTQNAALGIKSGSKLPKEYLQSAQKLVTGFSDVHSQLMVKYLNLILMYGPAYATKGNKVQEFSNLLDTSFSIIRKNKPTCQYSVTYFELMLGIRYQLQNRMKESLAVQRNILSRLTPLQASMQVSVSYNIGTAYYYLSNYKEAVSYFSKAVAVLERNKGRSKRNFPQLYYNYYTALTKLGDFKPASILLDSAYQHLRRDLNEKNEKNRLELETRYQTAEKQTQISELTLQQTQTQNRNRFILTLLGIAVVVAAALGFLGLRLRQANTRLQNLTQARDQLFGIVAHDLRRPMFAFQGIKALVGFHLRKQNYPAIETLSVALDESGVRLQKMLDNLVAWAMSQQESLPYQPENLHVHERVQEIVDLYAGVNLLKNVRFEVVIDQNLMAYADPNAFDLVVRNLIDNSFKALSQAGNLRISAQAEAPAIVLAFTDDAGGMPARKVTVIQRVFDAPQKAQVGQDGMGMGLITVGRFVQRNRGSISVESHEGKGTTFVVRLPAAFTD